MMLIILLFTVIPFLAILLLIFNNRKKLQEKEKMERCITENNKCINKIINEFLSLRLRALLKKKQQLMAMKDSLWMDELNHFTETVLRSQILSKIPYPNYFSDTEEAFTAIANRINYKVLELELESEDD